MRFNVLTWVSGRIVLGATRSSGRPILWGSVYGVLVYVVMNYVVIPLSATKRPAVLLS